VVKSPGRIINRLPDYMGVTVSVRPQTKKDGRVLSYKRHGVVGERYTALEYSAFTFTHELPRVSHDTRAPTRRLPRVWPTNSTRTVSHTISSLERDAQTDAPHTHTRRASTQEKNLSYHANSRRTARRARRYGGRHRPQRRTHACTCWLLLVDDPYGWCAGVSQELDALSSAAEC
jgi:hypothetical protein